MNNFQLVTREFIEKVAAFKQDWSAVYDEISGSATPRIDGNGKKIVDKRPDGKDYIVASYMASALDRHFPGWSWERASGFQFLGSEWIAADGTLSIIDEHLINYGIKPPVRRFWAGDAVRIQYRKGEPHTMENVIDIGDNMSAASTGAFKRAVNRLTHIGDDIYGRRLEHENAGTIESQFHDNPTKETFIRVINDLPGTWSDKLSKLGVDSLNKIDDFPAAYEKLKS